MNDYLINIFYSGEEDGYIADIPELERCTAFGLSPIIALHEVLMAKDEWIKKAKKAGRPIPRPSYQAIIEQVVLFDGKNMCNN
jgi:predicted RNase H-like HicB family nuclease